MEQLFSILMQHQQLIQQGMLGKFVCGLMKQC
jgi:hypothetical protein